MAECDQAVQIFVGADHGNAAQRHVLAEIFSAFGEDDAEGARGNLRVFEEHLVEIAHPVEQQVVGMRGLDLDELRHRRRDAPGVAGIAVLRLIGFGLADGLRERHGRGG